MRIKLEAALRRIIAMDLDLTDFDAAQEWVKKNVSDVYYEDEEEDEDEDDEDEDEDEDDEEESDEEIADKAYRAAEEERADDRLYSYMNKYDEVKSKSSIEIYRAVCLDNIGQLDLEAVGTYWSFEEEGVGCYGSGVREKEGNTIFTLKATISPKDIDWEYGLTSFMYYGEDQWECALEKGAEVTITHVDDKKLDEPLKGKA